MNFFATLLAVLAMASQTHAHSCMTDPPARMAPSGVYSEMCSAQKYELSSGNCNGGGGVGCRASQLDVDASVCGGPFQVCGLTCTQPSALETFGVEVGLEWLWLKSPTCVPLCDHRCSYISGPFNILLARSHGFQGLYVSHELSYQLTSMRCPF